MSAFKSFSVALALSTLLLSGCASFEKKELERVHAFPSTDHYASKPSVYVDIQFHRGEPGINAKAQANGKTIVRPAVENALQHANMFSHYTFDPSEKDSTDYTLEIDAYNHGNAIGAAVMGFICGYTFGVVPAPATDNYTLQFKAIDNQGEVLKEYANKDSITTWMGLWFIPMMGKTPKKAIDSTLENQVRLALQVLLQDGAFSYSPAQVSAKNQ